MRDSNELAGRTVVVTGAARGLGAAFATSAASRGADVILVDRVACGETEEAVRDIGGRAVSVACDITRPDEIAAAAGAILGERRSKLVLINNAGSYPTRPVEEMDLDHWRSVFALNVEGPMLFSLALIPAMKADGWGRIVNIASSIVTIARREVVAYTSSKMAVIGMSRALASDLGPHGITVNALSPGLTRTPGTEAQLGGTAKAGLFDHIAAQQVIPRPMVPDDLTGIACFLASDGSAMMTGQTLLVDGGMSRL